MAKSSPLELSIKIAGQVDRSLMAAIGTAQRNISSLSTTLSTVGTVGLAAMGALSVGTVKALNKCTDAAAAFENQMASVTKYVEGLADENGKISDSVWSVAEGGNGRTYLENYEEMSEAIKTLSTQIPYTKEQLTTLAAAAGQSGKSMSELVQYGEDGSITGFLYDVAKLGTAWDISADQAGDWAAKWEVALKMSHEQVMELADQINYLGAHNATTAAEIGNVVNSVASYGSIAGMDADETAALATALLAMGVSGDKAATSISRMYTNLGLGASATKAQREMWKSMGLTAEGVAKSMQEDATATMQDVFKRIGELDEDKQVAALKTLFGQWSIMSAAKLAENPTIFQDTLATIANKDLYDGSMQREFTIKNETAGAVETELANALDNLQGDIGKAFLPAKKTVSQAIITSLEELRKTPELAEAANTLASLLADGIEKAAGAIKDAAPTIKKALEYFATHGDQVVSVLKGMAAAFAAMKFAPAIEGTLRGVGGMIFGSGGGAGAGTSGGSGLVGMLGNLFRKGQAAPGAARTTTGNAWEFLQGFHAATKDSLLMEGASGRLNYLRTAGAAALNPLANSGFGQYMSRLGGAAANFGNKSGIWPLLKGTGTATAQVLGNIFGFGGSYNLGGGQVAQPLVNVPGIWQGIKNAGAGAASWIGGKAGAIANSKPVQAVGGFIGNVAQSAPVQGIASVVKGVGGWMGGTLSSGLQLAGTALGPLISGLGSVVAGAAPVVLAISAVIAVLSLLWDNVDALREPIGAIFGEKGLAVFDSFKSGLSGVFDFIQGLFDGGLADALSGVRDMFGNALDGGGLLSTIFGGTEGGLAAFDGLVAIGQSVLGFIGQVVSFANTTVKPMIVEIFNFITQTVMPTLISIFSSSAPTIASILTSVGNIIMSVVQGVMMVIQALWPSIQQIVTTVMNVAAVVIPALLNAIDLILPVIQGIIDIIIPVITVAISTVGGLISGLATSIGEIIGGIVEVFNGIIDFITGVFTGNWEQAWEGIKDIFGGVFDALAGLCKTPINAVIGIINGAIRGLNSISCDIPDWVPVVGGQKFGLNLKELPLLAKGGFTTGPSIAGEAGTEAVISFQRSARASNIATWTKAGQMLGIGNNAPVRLKDFDDYDDGGWRPGNDGGTYTITYAPTIVVQGGGSREDIDAALQEDKARFQRWYEEMRRNERRVRF